MRIAVIGAGIVGVTSAYELALDGHDVTVLERRSGVAAEASFAHAGLMSPGYLVPGGRLTLEAAGSTARLGRWFAPRSTAVPGQDEPRQRLYELARRSRERLLSLEATLQLSFEQQRGLLVLLRDKQSLVAARPALKRLAEYGERFHLIDAARAREIEPGLDESTPLQAAVHLPEDGVANGRLFAQLLKTEAQRLGARFLFDHEVLRIAAGSAGSAALQAQPRGQDQGPKQGHEQRQVRGQVQVHVRGPADAPELAPGFDAVVICAALGSGVLLAPLGLRLPLAMSQGYSITAPLQMREHAFDAGPRSALFDASHQVSISRLGDRVRVAGGAEAAGPSDRMNAEVLALLYKVLDDWFPGAAQTVRAQEWKGSRIALPDGLPLLGTSGQPGIWLNLAHGANGWALACGSARLLADAVRASVTGQPAPEGLRGLGVERLR